MPPGTTVAERARAAVRARPALHDALLAGVVNHAALAAQLDVDGDPGAVAAALRRYADATDPADAPTAPDAPDASTRPGSTTRVRMRSGVALVERTERGDDDADAAPDDAVHLAVGGTVVREGGSLTAVHASGDVDARGLEAVLGRLRVEGVSPEAAGFGGGSLLLVVARREGPDALRLVEDALKSS
jgi:hypothetical protein